MGGMEDVLKVNSFVQVNFLKEKLEDFSQTVPKLFKKIAFFLFCVRNRNFAQSLKTFLSTCVFTFSTFRISGVHGNINDKLLFSSSSMTQHLLVLHKNLFAPKLISVTVCDF